MPTDLSAAAIAWYDGHARDLPWRHPCAGAWAVLVSEIMLQQTPVARVLPAYDAWLARWPDAESLAKDSAGEAVRMWGRLGYPRRALRLHACATAIVERYGGAVPRDVDALLDLPGVGEYTARAIAAFAYRQRQPVVDTNVRRLLARAVAGAGQPGLAATASDRELAESLLPADPESAARASVAFMELGALICTARSPGCLRCPLRGACRWHRAGCPEHTGPRRRPQRYAGTDRQVRGLLLAVIRESDRPVPMSRLDAVWPDRTQRLRALDGLVADGLAAPAGESEYGLPGT
ncbi:MAG: A/G-specific adenine glycosylase [Mycobacteriales bacterium]